jgi:methylmalonyl-CoA mutase cobalamin-binding subunit
MPGHGCAQKLGYPYARPADARDQGIEVINLGEHNTCAGMINPAIAEKTDIVGVSFSAAALGT